MDDTGLCEAVCRQSTWLAELLVLLLVALRAAWLTRDRAKLRGERDSLQEKVTELSLRPPPVVSLQLAPNQGLASWGPIAFSPATGESISPAKSAENAAPTDSGHPSTPDPDYAEPPPDRS
jgi:hypothetical protein